jgi:hypothetical protein
VPILCRRIFDIHNSQYTARHLNFQEKSICRYGYLFLRLKSFSVKLLHLLRLPEGHLLQPEPHLKPCLLLALLVKTKARYAAAAATIVITIKVSMILTEGVSILYFSLTL